MLCFDFDIKFIRIILNMVFWGLEEENKKTKEREDNNIVVIAIQYQKEGSEQNSGMEKRTKREQDWQTKIE